MAKSAGRVRDELAREEARFRTTLAAGEKVLNDSLEVRGVLRLILLLESPILYTASLNHAVRG